MLANLFSWRPSKKLKLKISYQTGIILISGRIIRFFHILREEKWELCLSMKIIAKEKYKQWIRENVTYLKDWTKNEGPFSKKKLLLRSIVQHYHSSGSVFYFIVKRSFPSADCNGLQGNDWTMGMITFGQFSQKCITSLILIESRTSTH